MKHYFIVFLLFVLVTGSCRKDNNTGMPVHSNTAFADSSLGLLMADTIIYQVNIINKNPDDAWAAYCLRGLNHDAFIDHIFEMIYQGQAIAYDQLTHEKLTKQQIENMEHQSGFARSKISMVQFEESWYLNPVTNEITKKVISMTPGIAQFTENGEYKGDKALFKIMLR